MLISLRKHQENAAKRTSFILHSHVEDAAFRCAALTEAAFRLASATFKGGSQWSILFKRDLNLDAYFVLVRGTASASAQCKDMIDQRGCFSNADKKLDSKLLIFDRSNIQWFKYPTYLQG